MSTKYLQAGKTMPYSNSSGSTITAGTTVVVGSLLGKVIADIPDGETGDVSVEGVHYIPKVDAADITAGETITWDVSEGKADDDQATPATGDLTGGCVAWESKGATTDAEIAVKLNVGVNTVN